MPSSTRRASTTSPRWSLALPRRSSGRTLRRASYTRNHGRGLASGSRSTSLRHGTILTASEAQSPSGLTGSAPGGFARTRSGYPSASSNSPSHQSASSFVISGQPTAASGWSAARSPRPAIYYASSSQRLARDVQDLLLRLGINARVKQIPQGTKGRDNFHVIVSGRSDVIRFAEARRGRRPVQGGRPRRDPCVPARTGRRTPTGTSFLGRSGARWWFRQWPAPRSRRARCRPSSGCSIAGRRSTPRT